MEEIKPQERNDKYRKRRSGKGRSTEKVGIGGRNDSNRQICSDDEIGGEVYGEKQQLQTYPHSDY